MKIEKTHIVLKPDPKKVLMRPFEPASENQKINIISRIMALSESSVAEEVERLSHEFENRHRNITRLFLKRYEQVSGYIDSNSNLSSTRQLLIGASFCMEYSPESTALFNPSMVWHPDQSDLPAGSKRFIISLRATGEGHVSSIVFRTGLIDADNNINLEDSGNFVSFPVSVVNPDYDKISFREKINAAGLTCGFTERVLMRLHNVFSLTELETILKDVLKHSSPGDERNKRISEEIISIAASEYELSYTSDLPVSERIIFPRSSAESNGIEDARFVRFAEDDGSYSYYATYTAYNGMRIQSQLLETRDFLNFKIYKILGTEAKNKGMALFPRKINGKYAMLSRQDNENNFIMYSDKPLFWNSKILLSKPAFTWEMIQIGNCGSPIETGKGWLVLTHGVGPIRKYCIGAMLLDLHEPSNIIGRLKEPLLSADDTEREGYVPNVVYTCGSVIKGDWLIIPYAMSDYASSFAKVYLPDLLNELTSG